MIEAPQKIKKSYRIGVIAAAAVGAAALLPALLMRQIISPWVVFALLCWIVGGIIYAVGRRLTGGPLRPPHIK